MTIKRTPRRRGRPQRNRDLRIFVIATEDTHTARQYFGALAHNRVIDVRRIRLQVLPTEDGASSPDRVAARLDEFLSGDNGLDKKLDQFWLVLDVDRWPSRNLGDVAQKARQKGYELAVSNPCLELWLLLHFTDDVTAVRACATPAEQCEACAQTIRALNGSYNKTRLVPERYVRNAVTEAIERARALDDTPDERWPTPWARTSTGWSSNSSSPRPDRGRRTRTGGAHPRPLEPRASASIPRAGAPARPRSPRTSLNANAHGTAPRAPAPNVSAHGRAPPAPPFEPRRTRSATARVGISIPVHGQPPPASASNPNAHGQPPLVATPRNPAPTRTYNDPRRLRSRVGPVSFH